jgi:peptidoglycan/LPS O-acetylase OafA/YrhL
MGYHSGLPFVDGGFVGVDVFFVLSGFLITALLLTEWNHTGSIDIRSFYARRALRLLPALFVLLGAVLAAPGIVLAVEGRAAWKVVLVVLVYMANWFLARDVGSLGTMSPAWSLSIEEQFYILWPPVLALLLKWRLDRRWLAALIAIGVVGVWIERWMLVAVFDARLPRLYYGTDTRADGLLLGALVGVLAASGMLPTCGRTLVWARQAALPAIVTLLVLAHRAQVDFHAIGSDTVASMAAAVLLVSLLTSRPRFVTWTLERKALTWTGTISYGLYLWHVPTFHGLFALKRMDAFGVRGLRLHLLRFGGTFAIATASFFALERPVLKLKRYFRSGPTGGVALTSSSQQSSEALHTT